MSANWKRQALGDALEIASGQVDPTVEPYSEMPHIGGDNIESGTGRIIGSATANELGMTSGKYLFSSEDVLYSKIRPNLNKVALPAFAGICSADIYPLRPNLSRLSREFLAHLLRSNDFLEYTEKHSARTNIPKLNRESLLSYEALLPPIEEQRRIAEALDQAEALRVKRRAALAQLDALTQAIFLELFGDPATNPKGWPNKAVGVLASKFSDGPFGSNLKSSHYTETGVRVIRLQNIGAGEFVDNDRAFISERHFSDLKKHECLPGDVLVGTLGDPNLRACLQPEWLPRALNKADCVQLRVDQRIAHPVYVCSLLNQPSTERMAQELILGQTRLRISMGRLRGLQVPVPPIGLQHVFARRVAAVEKLKATHRASLAELDALFASLQHRAFRGEL